MKIEQPKCPNCGRPMVLRYTAKYQYRNGMNRKFWSCDDCAITHGAHPDGQPLGIPADKETKALRIRVHEEMSRIWGEFGAIGKARKGEMYDWMEKNTRSKHVAMMLKPELEEVLLMLRSMDRK